MGNKIITEKDFWKCSSGAVFAQLQGTRTSNKKSTGEVYITVADTSTSSWIDFGCTKNMMLAAIVGALVAIVVAVVVVALVVGTGGLGAIALIGIGGMMAIGAVGGVAGGLIMAAKGALQCGQKNATARTWDGSKDKLILTGTEAITGNRTMTCSVGGVVKFAPEVKSWMHALALSGLNYVTELAGCALGGAGVGALVFAGAGVAGGSLAIGWPSVPSVMSNVLQGFTGIWGSSRVLFGLDNIANEHAMGNVNDGWDVFTTARDGAIPEYGMAGRLLTGHAQPTDYMLFLYLLNIKTKTNKPPVEEPTTSGDKDGNNNNNKGNKEEPQNKTPEEEGATTGKGKGENDGKSKGGKDADAYEDPSNNKPSKKSRTSKPKLKANTPEHKAAAWEAYLNNPKVKVKKTYEEWSNRYDANMKNPGKGNKSADEHHKKIGWGEREVRMKMDENGNPIEVKKRQEERNLDIGDVKNKKAVEVKDYSSRKVPYSKEIKGELEFDKKLVEKGWDVEWVFKDQGPSKGLEAALKSPPPIKITILK